MSTTTRRPARWLAFVAAAALAIIGLTIAPASAAAPDVTISPSTAAPNTITTFAVTVSSTTSSSAAQTISITVPAGFSSPSLDSWTKPAPGWTVTGPTGSTWTFSTTSSSEKLNGTNTPLIANFTAVTPATAGGYAWPVSGTTNGSAAIAGFTSPTVTVGVVKQDQTISFANPGIQTYGTGPLTLIATASSGLAVSFTATDQCSLSGTSLSLDAAGSCTVTAHQAGNASYNAAADVERTFSISKASQTISFDPIGTQTFDTGPITLTATGGASGNAVTFTAAGGHCSVSGTSLSLDSAGDCTVTAHQAGNDNYLAATDVSRTFTIAKAQAVLSLSDLSYTYDGQPHGATVTTNPADLSGVTVTYDGSTTRPTHAGQYAVRATIDNPNYAADAVTDTLVIDQKHVTGTFTVADKDYDGSASAEITGCSVSGIEPGDDVSLDCSTATAAFADASAGDHTATIEGAVLGGDHADYFLDGVTDASGTIHKKTVTATLQAGDKIYDGKDTALVDVVLDGVITADLDTVSATVDTATFANKNVGENKTVTATVHLTGSAAGNYELASDTLSDTATISTLHITGTFTADDKEYDGGTTATVLTRSLVGAIENDDVSMTGGTASFDTKDVGSTKTVTLIDAGLSGADAGNYALDSVATATADIHQKPLTGSFTADDKVYDGNTDATVHANALVGVVGSEDVTLGVTDAAFGSKNVGAHKTVTAIIALGGSDAANYVLADDSSNTAEAAITARPVAGSFAVADKPWDGNTAATITDRTLSAISGNSSSGPVAGDDLSLDGGTATFDSSAAGTGKTVSGSDFTLSGNDAGNYSLVPAQPWYTNASILPLYSGKGFYQPVDMTPSGSAIVWNTVKGGQTVPLKFEIFNAQSGVEQTSLAIFGADASAQAKAFSAQPISCDTGLSNTEAAIDVTTTGGTSLRYDTTAGQFIQNWKTPTTVGSCFRVSVVTIDGSAVGPAYFKIKK